MRTFLMWILAMILGLMVATGCATTSTAADAMTAMMDQWEGQITLSNGTRIELGGGVRTEYYAYAQLDGVEGDVAADGAVE